MQRPCTIVVSPPSAMSSSNGPQKLASHQSDSPNGGDGSLRDSMPTGIVPADTPSFRLCDHSCPPGSSDPLRGFCIVPAVTLSFRLCDPSCPPGSSDPLRGFRIAANLLLLYFSPNTHGIIGIGTPTTMKTS